ncbi:MAG: flavin reductase [candidate division WOR-3 bacterium]|nr:flavin reductase [candidate division WOR-3 bacterium]
MSETPEDLSRDSRWPALFPSSICYVATSDGSESVVERVVGASVVNRFPFVVAVSCCVKQLSSRHYARRAFPEALEKNCTAALQFFAPGDSVDRLARVIASTPDDEAGRRVALSGLATRSAQTNPAPVFADAYMAYEVRLVSPGRDSDGQKIYESPWTDVGSHRVYFLEVVAIQLRRDIAEGTSQILWRSLPVWSPSMAAGFSSPVSTPESQSLPNRYWKRYEPHYRFPSAGTAAFEPEGSAEEMATKHFPPLPETQLEVDDDRARWPCFFPSSLGMITAWSDERTPNVMPCGSTTVVSRQPFVIACCISYAAINVRYAPRATLSMVRRAGRFGCGVPYIDDRVVRSIEYTGNISFRDDPAKVEHAGLQVEQSASAPILPALPIHFDCEVIGEIKLGTHVMFLGEVRQIWVRGDVGPDNPLEWIPYASISPGLSTDK